MRRYLLCLGLSLLGILSLGAEDCFETLEGSPESGGGDGSGDLGIEADGRDHRGTYTQVSAGAQHTCAATADRRVVCWGRDDFGQASPPDKPLESVSVGFAHTCGVLPGKTIECWGHGTVPNEEEPGWPPDTDQGVPTDQSANAQVACSTSYSCGLRPDHTVECWGQDHWNDDTQTGDPHRPPSSEFTHISAGTLHNCGVTVDDEAKCWGLNTAGQSAPPDGAYLQVSAGHAAFSCGITTTDQLRCWGRAFNGRLDHPGGQFLQVSAGNSHACAIRSDRTLACWGLGSDPNDDEGMDDHDQAVPPSGRFAQVSAGDDYTCALTTDGDVRCWGDDEYGKATPP